MEVQVEEAGEAEVEAKVEVGEDEQMVEAVGEVEETGAGQDRQSEAVGAGQVAAGTSGPEGAGAGGLGTAEEVEFKNEEGVSQACKLEPAAGKSMAPAVKAGAADGACEVHGGDWHVVRNGFSPDLAGPWFRQVRPEASVERWYRKMEIQYAVGGCVYVATLEP